MVLDVTGPHVHRAERGREGGAPTRPAEKLKGRKAETFGYSKRKGHFKGSLPAAGGEESLGVNEC